jgi:hypothetical protein
MRLVEAMRSGLITRPAVTPRFKLPEGRWRNVTYTIKPYRGRIPAENFQPHPTFSTRLQLIKTQQVTMADKANKVIEKQFNK